jgi:hypothetical protein
VRIHGLEMGSSPSGARGRNDNALLLSGIGEELKRLDGEPLVEALSMSAV